MNDSLFNDNNIDFSRFRKRRNIVIKILKHYEFSQSKNDELIIILSKSIFKFKKRIQITYIFINNESDIQTSIKNFKFAIKFQTTKFSTMLQFFVIKKRNFFQKLSYKRSIFDDLSFFFNSCDILNFYVDVFYVKII